MMGTADPQPSMFYHINLEQYVTADHPMRKIRPLIDTARIRQLSYADTGRPSIPPEQLFLALLGGYLLGVTSERALVRELTGNLVLRWFVGLDLDQMPWDTPRFQIGSGGLPRAGCSSGCLMRRWRSRSNRSWSHPIPRWMARWSRRMRRTRASSPGSLSEAGGVQEADSVPGSGAGAGSRSGQSRVLFRGERRSNQTHRSTTDPDAKLANKGNGTAAIVGYTVNGFDGESASVVTRHQCGVISWSASETDGGRTLLDRFHWKHAVRIQTVIKATLRNPS